MQTKRILCAIDFSAGARDALLAAADLAIQDEAVLVLVHVDERPLWLHEPYFHLPGDVRAVLRAESEAELVAWGTLARERGAKRVVTRLATGVAADEILAIAREEPPSELIVVGSHGRTGLKRMLIGSVAGRVVRHAPCSVLVVSPPAPTGEHVSQPERSDAAT